LLRSGAKLARELGVQLVSNQPQYSLLWRVIEPEVVPVCEELGLSQIVWSPLAQGVLTGKYLPGSPAPAGSRATDDKGGRDTVAQWLGDDVLTRVQEVRRPAAEAGLDTGTLALAWVLRNVNVSAAIVGASRPEQVHANARASGVRLDADLVAAVDAVFGPVVERDPAKVESFPTRP